MYLFLFLIFIIDLLLQQFPSIIRDISMGFDQKFAEQNSYNIYKLTVLVNEIVNNSNEDLHCVEIYIASLRKFSKYTLHRHCVTSVPIRSFFGPDFPAFGLSTERNEVSVRMWENTDQKNSRYGHFPRSKSRSIWHILERTKASKNWEKKF